MNRKNIFLFIICACFVAMFAARALTVDFSKDRKNKRDNEFDFSVDTTNASRDREKYPNSFYPLEVGNYWIYKRQTPDGWIRTEERVVEMAERDSHNCYKVNTKYFRLAAAESVSGEAFFEIDRMYCMIGGGVFDICMYYKERVYGEPFPYSTRKLRNRSDILLRLESILKLDGYWFDTPYREYSNEYSVLGFEDVYMHTLKKKFENCAKLRKTVVYNPRQNGFEWFCPGVGKVKDQSVWMDKPNEFDFMTGELMEYKVQ